MTRIFWVNPYLVGELSHYFTRFCGKNWIFGSLFLMLHLYRFTGLRNMYILIKNDDLVAHYSLWTSYLNSFQLMTCFDCICGFISVYSFRDILFIIYVRDNVHQLPTKRIGNHELFCVTLSKRIIKPRYANWIGKNGANICVKNRNWYTIEPFQS